MVSDRGKMIIQTPKWNAIRYTLFAPLYNLPGKYFDESRKKNIEFLDIQPTDHVCVIGGGTGLDVKYLPTYTKGVVVEVSPYLVRKMTRKFGSSYPNLKFEIGNAEHLLFENNSFNKVVVHLVLAVTDCPKKIVETVNRITVSSGKIAVFDVFCHPNLRLKALWQFIDIGFRLFMSSALLQPRWVVQNVDGSLVEDVFDRRTKWYRRLCFVKS